MDINELQSVYHVPNVSNPCYVVNITAEHGIWQSENPLTQALPLLAMQLSTVIFVTRAVYYILRPFRVPRIVADILGGILVGPTALGNYRFFRNLFPLRSILIVETVAYWALACHMFLVGLEMDMYAVLRASKRVIHVAVAGVVIPFIMGIGLFFLMTTVGTKDYNQKGCFFWAVSLAVTGYPIVTRVLADLKLQHIEVGRTAMSAALVSDFIAWILVTILIPARINALTTAVAVFCTAGFAVVCVLWVRPVLKWIIRKTSGENNTYSEHYLCFVLVSVSLFAVVTEVLGTNSIVGAFIFGLIMPDRTLANALLEKFEDFMSGYFLPLFFTVCGIKINIWSINDGNWLLALVVIAFACSAKILSTFAASYFYQMPRRETVSLGVVLNTKGVLAIVVLNMGVDKRILRSQDYSVMAIAILLMTIAVGPIIGSVYRASKRLSHYKRRTIQKGRPDSELRILACFQSFRNVSGMISLIDSSNANKKSPLAVFALHLVELTGRASAMLIVHSTGKSSGSSTRGRRNSHSEKIIGALETYETLNDNVTINALTSLSPFATMHEDICSLAEDKHVACLIIPFHKLPSKEGKLEEENHTSFRGVNLNVLANAPCSVGIFVDKGFGSAAANGGDSRLTMRQIAMLFIGGPDDREALAYAWRMAGTDGISLTVVRFLPGDQVEEIEPLDLPAIEQHKMLTAVSYVDRNRRLDDEYVNEFRLKVAGEQFISYEEKVVNNDEEIVLALREMHHMYDLYVVGKGEGIVSPLTAGLADWCEYPELGPMGDLLVTSSFAQGSVLVMQQFTGARDGNFDMMSADGSGHGSERFGNWRNSTEGDDFGGLEEAPFANHNARNGVGASRPAD